MNELSTHPEAPTDASAPGSALAGKYMTFKLAGEVYGLAILKVRELIGLMDITRVPGAPSFVRGVINLRGKVIPVVDVKRKFGMDATLATEQTVIIVVQVAAHDGGELTMGILVDEVLEVLDIDTQNVEPPPSFGVSTFEPEFLLGVGKVDTRVVFLLDIDQVLSKAERAAVVSASP